MIFVMKAVRETKEVNEEQAIHEIERLHKRANAIWEDKEKYWKSMKKSSYEIGELAKKEQT
jgi:hypothetical protein